MRCHAKQVSEVDKHSIIKWKCHLEISIFYENLGDMNLLSEFMGDKVRNIDWQRPFKGVDRVKIFLRYHMIHYFISFKYLLKCKAFFDLPI